MPQLGLINNLTSSGIESAASFTNDYSLAFEGDDEYVDISITNFMDADFSIGYWAKNDGSSPDYWRGISFSPTYQTGMFIAHSRIVGQDSDDTVWNKSFPSVGGTNGGSHGEWHYRVVTYDISEKTFTLYVDDATPTTEVLVGNLKTDEDMIRIGRSSGYYFEGNIDEVAVWSSVLTSDEVAEIYGNTNIDLSENDGNYVSSSNLIGYWRMGDGDTFDTITDNSTNSNDGTMINMVSGDIEENTP